MLMIRDTGLDLPVEAFIHQQNTGSSVRIIASAVVDAGRDIAAAQPRRTASKVGRRVWLSVIGT
jgi:hypothetical protein